MALLEPQHESSIFLTELERCKSELGQFPIPSHVHPNPAQQTHLSTRIQTTWCSLLSQTPNWSSLGINTRKRRITWKSYLIQYRSVGTCNLLCVLQWSCTHIVMILVTSVKYVDDVPPTLNYDIGVWVNTSVKKSWPSFEPLAIVH